MDLSLGFFVRMLAASPPFCITVLLTLGVILVNGWTDAPNAIATCVVTRCLSARAAILFAAVLNFLGVLTMSIVNTTVAQTVTRLVDFGTNAHEALIALAAALLAIVVWATLAWAFGIPTSESHALIAGLTGGAIALSGGLSGVNGGEWVKVLYGLAVSVLFGAIAGYLICRAVTALFRRADRRKSAGFFRGAQIFGAGAMAFMHGAQDGQKFMAVILLGLFLANGQTAPDAVSLPVWLMLLSSAVMGIGTSIGGKKIIKSVGMDMVRLEPYQGFSADVAASSVLFFCSLFGIPVSTTHVKTTAIMGVGAVKRVSAVNFSVVREMLLAWVLTFPGCGLIGYGMAKLFMFLF